MVEFPVVSRQSSGVGAENVVVSGLRARFLANEQQQKRPKTGVRFCRMGVSS
jgi:hypothetical protein